MLEKILKKGPEYECSWIRDRIIDSQNQGKKMGGKKKNECVWSEES